METSDNTDKDSPTDADMSEGDNSSSTSGSQRFRVRFVKADMQVQVQFNVQAEWILEEEMGILVPCLVSFDWLTGAIGKVLANERRRYLRNVFSHWLRPCLDGMGLERDRHPLPCLGSFVEL